MDESTGRVSRALAYERAVWLALFCSLGALKLVYAFRLRIDSDETQHLHVVWAWTQHLLPYRDVFDNHSPLFQFLCAPVLAAIGARPQAVTLMRLVVVPLFFATLWLAYKIARRLWSRAQALDVALFTGAFPIFFVKSCEFRPDDLWTPLWLMSILAATARPFRIRHAFLSGLALGACFSTTMKTSVLALSLGIGVVALLLFKLSCGECTSWPDVTSRFVAAVAGLIVLPAFIVIFFAREHALPALYYGTIAHNLTPRLFTAQFVNRFGLMGAMLGIALLGGAWAWREASRAQREFIVLIATIAAVSLSLIMFVWPLVEPHDILPVAPIALVFCIPVGDRIAKLIRLKARTRRYLFSALAIIEMFILLVSYSPFRDEMSDKLAFIRNVLSLTNPDEFVMDPKGESVFRPRPFFYVLEGITLRRIKLGLLADDIPAHLIATRTAVATTLRLPSYACDFVEENYLPVAFRLRVLGQKLGQRPNDSPLARKIDIVIPARYAIVAERGVAVASIDGVAVHESRELEPGLHDIVVTGGNGDIDLIWARAIEKGFSPFGQLASDAPGASD